MMVRTTLVSRIFLVTALAAVAVLMLLATSAVAAVVAKEDFDGGAMNLISGFNPATDNLDGGPGDWFGVGNLGAWPQGYPPGAPFSLVDDSVVSVSNPNNAPFPTDMEAVYGQNRVPENDFFGISDTREWTPEQRTASWTFNISNASNLMMSIDMGGMSDGSAFPGFDALSLITFSYSIDGSSSTTAFSLTPNPNFGNYMYREMDSFIIPTVGLNGPLEATGTNAVTKTLVDTGAVAGNTFLNKSPASGTGTGQLDTFTTAINGTGSQLVLTMTADLAFEAMAFDNIQIVGDVEAAGLVGDYNGNDVVDAADYTVWRNNLGTAFALPNRDPSNSGNVNPDDYDSWKAHFGEMLPGGGGLVGGAVPEPASILLVAAGLTGLGLGRRGRV